MPSGIAAHCDPSLCGDLGREAPRIITGDAHAKPNREIRVSNLRQLSRRRRSRDNIAQRGARGRQLPFRAEGPNASGRSLVLPYRSRHQTPLLVSQRGARRAFANRPAEFVFICETDFAGRSGDATFDSERSRRTTRAGEYRTAEPQRCADSGDASGCSDQGKWRGYEDAGRGGATIDRRFALARSVGFKPLDQSDAV